MQSKKRTTKSTLMVLKIKSRLASVARHAHELIDALDAAGEIGTVHEMRLAAKLQDIDTALVDLLAQTTALNEVIQSNPG